nr:hypothetical protein [Escherichia coli]
MSHYKTGHKQPRFRYSVLARCVAWANISVQVLFPLAVTFTPVMAARAQHAVQPRLSMGNTTVTADNNVEKNVASFAANAGTFLSSQPDSDATRNFITGMATAGNDSNLLIVFYVQIMPDDFVMQLHRF